MLSFRVSLGFVLTTALFASPGFASHSHRAPASGHLAHSGKGHKSTHRTAHRVHGQQAIQPERVTEIQQALIRQHYLNGDANGAWDATTQAAMQKYQADHGWQTKLMPDSRALKTLGLGPNYSDAINAKTASFKDPPPINSIPSEQAAGFASAAGTN